MTALLLIISTNTSIDLKVTSVGPHAVIKLTPGADESNMNWPLSSAPRAARRTTIDGVTTVVAIRHAAIAGHRPFTSSLVGYIITHKNC